MLKFWNYISNIGVLENEEKNELRKIHLINRMCFLSTFTTFFFMSYMFLFLQSPYWASQQLVCGLLCGLYLLFNSRRWYRFSLYWIFFNILLNVFYVSLEEKGAGVEYFLIPLGLLPFVMEEKLIMCFVTIILCFITFTIGYFIREAYVPHEYMTGFETTVTYLVVTGSVFFLCFFILIQFKTVYTVYEKIIEHQRDEVREKNKEITDSIHYAKRIQQSLLPTSKYIDKNIKRLKKE